MIEISMGSLKGQLNYYGSDHFIFDVDSAFDSKLFGNQLTQHDPSPAARPAGGIPAAPVSEAKQTKMYKYAEAAAAMRPPLRPVSPPVLTGTRSPSDPI